MTVLYIETIMQKKTVSVKYRWWFVM